VSVTVMVFLQTALSAGRHKLETKNG